MRYYEILRDGTKRKRYMKEKHTALSELFLALQCSLTVMGSPSRSWSTRTTGESYTDGIVCCFPHCKLVSPLQSICTFGMLYRSFERSRSIFLQSIFTALPC